MHAQWQALHDRKWSFAARQCRRLCLKRCMKASLVSNLLRGCAAGWVSPRTDVAAIWRLFTGSWMSLLLLAVPFGWIAHFVHWGSVPVFVLVRARAYSGSPGSSAACCALMTH
jgi:hypothetical protein